MTFFHKIKFMGNIMVKLINILEILQRYLTLSCKLNLHEVISLHKMNLYNYSINDISIIKFGLLHKMYLYNKMNVYW